MIELLTADDLVEYQRSWEGSELRLDSARTISHSGWSTYAASKGRMTPASDDWNQPAIVHLVMHGLLWTGSTTRARTVQGTQMLSHRTNLLRTFQHLANHPFLNAHLGKVRKAPN